MNLNKGNYIFYATFYTMKKGRKQRVLRKVDTMLSLTFVASSFCPDTEEIPVICFCLFKEIVTNYNN